MTDDDDEGPSTTKDNSKQPRVLACLLCQQRKVRCDRRFPCANCTKAKAQCVPATLVPRQRRRRFPERVLLERLRYYESLLRKNQIVFEPLHPSSAENPDDLPTIIQSGHHNGDEVAGERPAASTAYDSVSGHDKGEEVFEIKNIWNALVHTTDISNELDYDSGGYEDDGDLPQGDIRQAVVKKSWDLLKLNNDDIIFGSPKANIDLSTLHPTQVHVFRLWQIYLENVDPLLKVTHTPTLQVRILDAASGLQNVGAALEALMFSIYCAAIHSITDEDCLNLFGSPCNQLMACYRFACQQALLNCRVLRSDDPDCLTALFLYLVATKHQTDPRSTSSMLGVAIRLGMRIGLQNEATYKAFTPLEAEIRRRLWWSLIIFDNRICEMFDYKCTSLIPSWDCNPPINANDSDFQAEMKMPPPTHERPTEAIFTVLRCETSDFVRRSAFHLDFANPYLKRIHAETHRNLRLQASGLKALDEAMQKKYLQFCNPDNPLHITTVWTTRAYLAKLHVLEHTWKYSSSSTSPTDAQREAIIPYALQMLECDAHLMTSPLAKRYIWYSQSYFPFLAYVHLLQDLRVHPISPYSDRVWTVLGEHYDIRFGTGDPTGNPLFKLVFRIVSQAWEAREAVSQNPPESVPSIVAKTKVTMESFSSACKPEHGMADASFQHPLDPMDILNLRGPVMGANGPAFGPSDDFNTQAYPPSAIPMAEPFSPSANAMSFPHVDWETFDWTALDNQGQ